MAISRKTEFNPEWVSPPGETIVDILNQRNIRIDEFASMLGQSRKRVDELLKGVLQITVETAELLSRHLGASKEFWLQRDEKYRNQLYRLAGQGDAICCKQWLAELPLAEMKKWGWIQSFDDVIKQSKECLQFFGESSQLDWRNRFSNLTTAVAYRTSPTFPADFGAVSAWVRKAEINSLNAELESLNKEKLRSQLPQLRKLTRVKQPAKFLPQLVHIAAQCGVFVSIVPSPKGCRASGATFISSEGKAILLLSFRYLSDDHFWFTFFHEVGHLLLHDINKCFIEGIGVDSQAEREANAFSQKVLIPIEHQASLTRPSSDATAIIKLAKAIGISPGILVGQMQFNKILRPNQMNALKVRYKWEDVAAF